MPRGGSQVSVKISCGWKTTLLKLPVNTQKRAILCLFLRSLTSLVLPPTWTDKQTAAFPVRSPLACLSVGPRRACIPRGVFRTVLSFQRWDGANRVSCPFRMIDSFSPLVTRQEHAHAWSWNLAGENFTQKANRFCSNPFIYLFTRHT